MDRQQFEKLADAAWRDHKPTTKPVKNPSVTYTEDTDQAYEKVVQHARLTAWESERVAK